MAKTRAQIQQELRDTARDFRSDGPEVITSGTNYPADLAAYQVIQTAIGDRLTDAQTATMFDKMANSPAALAMFDRTQTDNPITKSTRANLVLPALADVYKTNPAGFERLLKLSPTDPRMNAIVADINDGNATFDRKAIERLAAAPAAAPRATPPAGPAPAAPIAAAPVRAAASRPAAAQPNPDAADLAQPARTAAPTVAPPPAPLAAVAAAGRGTGQLGPADDVTYTRAQADALTANAQGALAGLQADITKIVGADAAVAFTTSLKPDELAFMMQDSRWGQDRAAFLEALRHPGAGADMANRPDAYVAALSSGDVANQLASRLVSGTAVMDLLPQPGTLTGPHADQLEQGFANLRITEEGRAAWLYAAQKGGVPHPDGSGDSIFARNLDTMQKMMAADAAPPAGMTEAQMAIVMKDFAESPAKYAGLLGDQDFDAGLKRVATAEIAGQTMGWNFDGVGPYFSGMMGQLGDMFKGMMGGFKDMFGDLLGGFGLNLDGVAAKQPYAPEGVEAQANTMNVNPMGTEADYLERKRQAAMGMGAAPTASAANSLNTAPQMDPTLVPTG
ncbi:MAG: hypothetical protein V4621_01850 [Pseudomonadota bacterium]